MEDSSANLRYLALEVNFSCVQHVHILVVVDAKLAKLARAPCIEFFLVCNRKTVARARRDVDGNCLR